MYGMDPVVLLEERDVFRWQVREAALLVWQRDQAAMIGEGEPDDE